MKRNAANLIIGGYFELKVDRNLIDDGGGKITLQGLFEKTQGTGTAVIGPTFEHGDVLGPEKSKTGMKAGTLKFIKPLKLENLGNIQVAQNTRIEFDGGFTQTSGSFELHGALSAVGFAMSGGTFDAFGGAGPLPTIACVADAQSNGTAFTIAGGVATLSGTTVTAEEIALTGGHVKLFANNTFTAAKALVGEDGQLHISYGAFFYVDEFVNEGFIEFGMFTPTFLPGGLTQYARNGSANGSFVQSSTGQSKFWVTQTSQTGALDVHGNAVVNGKCVLALISGSQASLGGQFWVLNANTLSVGCSWVLPPLPPGPPPPYPQRSWVSHWNNNDGRWHFYWRVQ